MSKSSDWLSKNREAILAMVDGWIEVCGLKKTIWGIPDTAATGLSTLRGTAADALTTAKNELTRTPVATAQCKEAFNALSGFMRDFKRRYFLTPPLTASDFVSLGLQPRDGHPSPSGTPTAQVTIETSWWAATSWAYGSSTLPAAPATPSTTVAASGTASSPPAKHPPRARQTSECPSSPNGEKT